MLSSVDASMLAALAAESAAIVVSILLAFAIDAWWAGRQARSDEEKTLLALKSDFEATLASIGKIRKYRAGVIESADRLLSASAGVAQFSPEEVDRLIKDLLWTGKVDFSTGALDSLIHGGTLANIRNAKLRQQLTSFNVLVDSTRERDRRKQKRLHSFWFPFLFKKSSFVQIQQSSSRIPGLDSDIELPRIPVPNYQDHSQLLENSEFHAMVAVEFISEFDMLRWCDVIEGAIDNSIQLIDGELRSP